MALPSEKEWSKSIRAAVSHEERISRLIEATNACGREAPSLEKPDNVGCFSYKEIISDDAMRKSAASAKEMFSVALICMRDFTLERKSHCSVPNEFMIHKIDSFVLPTCCLRICCSAVSYNVAKILSCIFFFVHEALFKLPFELIWFCKFSNIHEVFFSAM